MLDLAISTSSSRGRDDDQSTWVRNTRRPWRAPHHDGARGRDRAAFQARNRLPAHRHGEDREELTYVQGATNVTRMDYLSPLPQRARLLAGPPRHCSKSRFPPRATWIRMLMTELNRISSHVLWMATNGMDLASTSMMIYGFRDREMILSFFEKTTGLRMNHDYIRPGGVAADLPDGWEDDVMSIIETIPGRVDEYDEMLTGQPIFKRRTEGSGSSRPSSPSRCRPRGRSCGPRAWPGPSPCNALSRLRRRRFRRHRRHGRRRFRTDTPCG